MPYTASECRFGCRFAVFCRFWRLILSLNADSAAVLLYYADSDALYCLWMPIRLPFWYIMMILMPYTASECRFGCLFAVYAASDCRFSCFFLTYAASDCRFSVLFAANVASDCRFGCLFAAYDASDSRSKRLFAAYTASDWRFNCLFSYLCCAFLPTQLPRCCVCFFPSPSSTPCIS